MMRLKAASKRPRKAQLPKVGGESQRASGHEYAGREQSRRSARRVSVRRLHSARRTGGRRRPLVFPMYFLSNVLLSSSYWCDCVPVARSLILEKFQMWHRRIRQLDTPRSLPNLERSPNQLLPGAASHTMSRLKLKYTQTYYEGHHFHSSLLNDFRSTSCSWDFLTNVGVKHTTNSSSSKHIINCKFTFASILSDS